MIDNPEMTERLLWAIEEALPIEAQLTPAVVQYLKDILPQVLPFQTCKIVSIDYGGEGAGIICRLDLSAVGSNDRFVISLTHLSFDPRLPLSRRIAAYRKHRLKTCRRIYGRDLSGEAGTALGAAKAA